VDGLAIIASLLAISLAVTTFLGLERGRLLSLLCTTAGVALLGTTWLTARRSHFMHRRRWFFFAAAGVLVAGGVQLWPASSTPPPREAEGGTPTETDIEPSRQPSRESQSGSPELCLARSNVVAGDILYQVPGNPSRFGGEGRAFVNGEAAVANRNFTALVDVDQSNRVVLLDSTGGTVISRLFDGEISDLSVSDAGDVLALEALAGDTRLVFWRTESDEATIVVDPASRVSQPAISPDSGSIAWVQQTSDGSVIRVGELAGNIDGTTVARGTSPSWSPDSSSIVYSAPFGEGRAIFAKRVESESIASRMTQPQGATDNDPVVAPDCTTIAFTRSSGDNIVTLVLSGDNTDARTIGGSSPQIRPSFS